MLGPALLALTGGSGLVGGFLGQKAQKIQNKLAKKQANYNMSQAIRNRQRTEMDARLQQRMAEEGAAASGGYDPAEALNYGVQAVDRVKDRNAMDIASAREAESMAASNLSALKKQIRQQRQSYYADMAMQLLQMGVGAYSMLPSGAPAPQYGSTVNQVPMGKPMSMPSMR